MKLSSVSTPEVYREESPDFRFFLDWFEKCLTRIHHDIENISDIYDPLRCSSELIWLLASTMGYKYDDRLCAAFNRLVLVYFMSMIRNRGSKDGVTLAAETNLAQFNIDEYGKENSMLFNRLEDTSIPVNAVSVTPHTSEGYIDVVYFSDKVPVDACIEYVRPLGMYMFQHAGVRYDARTKISIDARLTNTKDIGVSIGSTHVGHYSRNDYARMQKMLNEPKQILNQSDTRSPVWYRNSEAEGSPDSSIDPGYRALNSLQLSNNEHIFKSLINPIFGLGYTPTDVSTYQGPSILPSEAEYPKTWNLRYDRAQEEEIGPDVYTIDADRTSSYTSAKPVVNPIMNRVGDAIVMDATNTHYTEVDDDGTIHVN